MHKLLAVLISGAILAGCGPKKSKGPDGSVRIYPCRRVKGTIKVDGKIDELAWKLAFYESKFTVAGTESEPRAGTAMRFVWDDEFLYVACVMMDLDVCAVLKEHDAKLWLDDAVAVILKPYAERGYYYEIQVNPLGTVRDMLVGARGAGSDHRWTPWQSGTKTGIVVEGSMNDWSDEDKGWMFEAAIPLKAFAPQTPKPQLGDRWRFAVGRINYSVHLPGGREETCSARLAEPDLHRYEEYDILEFAD